jgi:hypothetical protein
VAIQHAVGAESAVVAKERQADCSATGAIFVNRAIENGAHAATFAPGPCERDRRG